VETQKQISNFLSARQSTQEKVCRFIALSGLTFRQVASKEVKGVLVDAHYKDPPSTHTTVRALLNKFSATVVSKYQDQLADKRKIGKLTVIIDEWTSNANRRYMGVVVRSYDCDHTKEQLWNLGLQVIVGSATAANCKEALVTRLQKFSIDLKADIVSVVSDGASVMTFLGKLIEPTMRSGNIVSEARRVRRKLAKYRCLARGISISARLDSGSETTFASDQAGSGTNGSSPVHATNAGLAAFAADATANIDLVALAAERAQMRRRITTVYNTKLSINEMDVKKCWAVVDEMNAYREAWSRLATLDRDEEAEDHTESYRNKLSVVLCMALRKMAVTCEATIDRDMVDPPILTIGVSESSSPSAPLAANIVGSIRKSVGSVHSSSPPALSTMNGVEAAMCVTTDGSQVPSARREEGRVASSDLQKNARVYPRVDLSDDDEYGSTVSGFCHQRPSESALFRVLQCTGSNEP
jgi:hypothetical protein